MASRTNKSTSNQGPRLGKASTSKTFGNPMKPVLRANIKLSQGTGGGLKQRTGTAANYVTKNTRGGATGIKQKGTTARKPAATRVGVNKLNKKPVSAQPKYPRGNTNTLVKHNSVSKADTSRLRKASNLALPTMGGGGFKSFIKGQ